MASICLGLNELNMMDIDIHLWVQIIKIYDNFILNLQVSEYSWHIFTEWYMPEIFQGMGSANERRRYYVTPSLIGRAHAQNDPWYAIWPCLVLCRSVLYVNSFSPKKIIV